MKKAGVKFPIYGTTATSNKFEDQIFVITGTLSQSRDYYKNLIENNGGKVSSSVSSMTNYLLAGESAGSKLEKANKLDVEVISEEQFNELLK
jgi:DNA ligase (NAD+)